MIPAPFEYARPTTVEEALQAIASGGEDVKILACGCGWPHRRPSST
jgi:carbon-monoxide dehydrogenase medium subunit